MNKNLTNETFQKHLGLLNKKLQLNEDISEVTNEGSEPDGLMGAVVSSVKSENGIVYIRLDAKTKDGLATMFDAKLV